MDLKNNCPVCGANIAPHDFVCDYCGHVLFDRVKNTDSLKSGKESFDEGIEIIKENLNALYDIPKPSSAQTIGSSIRLILALLTFGIVLLFWHRPKKRFIKANYDKLKSIISRNISFLKISSTGSNDLMSRLKVLENELLQIDKSIQKGILSKTITTVVIIVLYLTWIIYIASKEPVKHSTYFVTSYDSLAQGNLSNNIRIPKDSVKIIHAAKGLSEEWEMVIKLSTTGLKGVNNKNLSIKNELILTDEFGIEVKGFEHAEMDKTSLQKLISALNKQNTQTDYYKYLIKNDINFPQYRDTIPINVHKFTINIDSSTKGN